MLFFCCFWFFFWALLLNVLYCVFQWVKWNSIWQLWNSSHFEIFWAGEGNNTSALIWMKKPLCACVLSLKIDCTSLLSWFIHLTFFKKKSHNFIQIIMAHNCKLFSTKVPMPWDKVTSKTNLPLIWKKQIKESYNLQNGSSNLSPQMTIISPFYCFIFLILSG